MLSVELIVSELAISPSSLPMRLSPLLPLRVETSLTCTSQPFYQAGPPMPSDSRQTTSNLLAFRPSSRVSSSDGLTRLVAHPPIPTAFRIDPPSADETKRSQRVTLSLSISVYSDRTALFMGETIELTESGAGGRFVVSEGSRRLTSDGESLDVSWKVDVPRGALSVGQHARSKSDGTGRLHGPTMKRILERALVLEEKERKDELVADLAVRLA